MSVKFIPAVTRTITDVPAKVVLELPVEQAARYHALLGRLTGAMDHALYEELSEKIPESAQLRCTIPDVIRPTNFVSRF